MPEMVETGDCGDRLKHQLGDSRAESLRSYLLLLYVTTLASQLYVASGRYDDGMVDTDTMQHCVLFLCNDAMAYGLVSFRSVLILVP